jgi:hypothetical protein
MGCRRSVSTVATGCCWRFIAAPCTADCAFKSLEEHGAQSGSAVNPAAKLASDAVKQVTALAAKLRLCPSARLDRKVAGPAARLDHGGPKPWLDRDEHEQEEAE